MIRQAKLSDAEGLHRLARLLNSTNLPDEPGGIEEILMTSCRSFDGSLENPAQRVFLFILEDLSTQRVIGSSQIIARHGNPELPHIYFQIKKVQYHSNSLNQTLEHRLLKIGFNIEGMTEIGGLILDPAYRHLPQRLGKLLSLIRFWFIQQHPEYFQNQLLAELLPPFEDNGESTLWKAIGQHFIPLSYREADHLSRKQKEFIETLFPTAPIYVDLLPSKAQEVLGKIGKGSQAAAHMLSQLGFQFENRIDPFDGGPHFEMNTRDLPTIHLDSLQKHARISNNLI